MVQMCVRGGQGTESCYQTVIIITRGGLVQYEMFIYSVERENYKIVITYDGLCELIALYPLVDQTCTIPDLQLKNNYNKWVHTVRLYISLI